MTTEISENDSSIRASRDDQQQGRPKKPPRRQKVSAGGAHSSKEGMMPSKPSEHGYNLSEVSKEVGFDRQTILEWVQEQKVKVAVEAVMRGESYIFSPTDLGKIRCYATVQRASARRAQDPQEPPRAQALKALPEWCNVYKGLTNAEIAEIEAVMLDRSRFMRPPAESSS